MNTCFKRRKSAKGFTLIELVVVMAVIAILAGVSVGAYFGITNNANESAINQTSTQIKGLYNQYQVNAAANGAKGTLKDQCDSFADYVIENGLDNNLNYYVSDAFNAAGEDLNYEENHDYQVRFIVTDDGTKYVATFAVEINDGKLGNIIEESDAVYKTVQEGSDSILDGVIPAGPDGHIELSEWEYIWDDNKPVKTPLLDIKLEIPNFSDTSKTIDAKLGLFPLKRANGSTIHTIQVRQGKTITVDTLSAYYPQITTWVSNEGTSTVDTEWLLNGQVFDFSKPITEEITITASPTGIAEQPFNPTAYISRGGNRVIKQVRYYEDGVESTEKERLEVIQSDSSNLSITYYQSVSDAINAASSYVTSTKYEVYVCEKEGGGCFGGDTSWSAEKARPDLNYEEVGQQVYDVVRIVPNSNAVIDSDAVLKKGASLLLSTGNDYNGNPLENIELQKGYLSVTQDGKQASDLDWTKEKEPLKTDLGFGNDAELNAELKVFDGDNKLAVNKLAVAPGHTLTIEGKMVVPAWVGLNSNVSSTSQSCILGKYAYVDIQEGATILNHGQVLSYGVIGGEGKLVSGENGSVESRMSVIWPSTSTASSLYLNNIFPVTSYHIDGIKGEAVFQYGSSLNVGLIIYGSRVGWSVNFVNFISTDGNEGLFTLKDSSSSITKSHHQDESNDGKSMDTVTLSGNVFSKSYLADLSIGGSGFPLAFDTQLFPLNNIDVLVEGNYNIIDVNFVLKDRSSIVVKNGATVTVGGVAVIDADADFIVENGGTVVVAASSNTIYSGDFDDIGVGIGGHMQVQEGGKVEIDPEAVTHSVDFIDQKTLGTSYRWDEKNGQYVKESKKVYFERISEFTYGPEANSSAAVSYYYLKLDGQYDSAFVNALKETVLTQGGYVNFRNNKNEIIIPTTVKLTYADLGTPTQENAAFKGWSFYQDAITHAPSNILSSSTIIASNQYLYPVFGVAVAE